MHDGVTSPGHYLFYVADGAPDLIAFVFPCDTIAGTISGNVQTDTGSLCNASQRISLTDPTHVRFARTAPHAARCRRRHRADRDDGKEVVSGITTDAEGNVYLFGLTDGNMDKTNDGGQGPDDADNEMFVARLAPDGTRTWATEIVLSEGSIFKDAVTDDAHLYAVGRTQGALPGYRNTGWWDAIIVKFRLSDGAIVATDQFGSPGIDGYGNAILDDDGALYVSAQGAPAGGGTGPSGTDKAYLVAKHDAATLANIWRVVEEPEGDVLASAEAWGGLSYAPGAIPGDGKLVAAGWYFAARGADAFVSVYEDLNGATPTRTHALSIAPPGVTADWVMDNAIGPDGSIYVAGYTTGALQGNRAGRGRRLRDEAQPDPARCSPHASGERLAPTWPARSTWAPTARSTSSASPTATSTPTTPTQTSAAATSSPSRWTRTSTCSPRLSSGRLARTAQARRSKTGGCTSAA